MSKVAILKTSPGTAIEDYSRLMGTVEFSSDRIGYPLSEAF
ncbi:MAG: hypothetical protein WBC40_04185 [Halobacteriota archaeon]